MRFITHLIYYSVNLKEEKIQIVAFNKFGKKYLILQNVWYNVNGESPYCGLSDPIRTWGHLLR